MAVTRSGKDTAKASNNGTKSTSKTTKRTNSSSKIIKPSKPKPKARRVASTSAKSTGLQRRGRPSKTSVLVDNGDVERLIAMGHSGQDADAYKRLIAMGFKDQVGETGLRMSAELPPLLKTFTGSGGRLLGQNDQLAGTIEITSCSAQEIYPMN